MLKNRVLLLILSIFIILLSSCDSAEPNPNPNPPKYGALKYVIKNDSDNIIDKVYFHSDYSNYKSESNALDIEPLEVGEQIEVCPIGDEYITFRRSISKIDNKKIYVTSSIRLNYEYGIITIKLGDSDFYVYKSQNPKKECVCDGRNCITGVDSCDTNPCIHGRCTNTDIAYECRCYRGYSGINCDKIDFCSNNSCNNGECENLEDNYRCNCYDGYSGDNCEITSCENTPCSNENTQECKVTQNGYECICKVGYEGKNCENN